MKRRPKQKPVRRRRSRQVDTPNYENLYKRALQRIVECEKLLGERLLDDVGSAWCALDLYKARVASVLTTEEREFARIAQCPEDEYAIQLIELCRRKLDWLKSKGIVDEY